MRNVAYTMQSPQSLESRQMWEGSCKLLVGKTRKAHVKMTNSSSKFHFNLFVLSDCESFFYMVGKTFDRHLWRKVWCEPNQTQAKAMANWLAIHKHTHKHTQADTHNPIHMCVCVHTDLYKKYFDLFCFLAPIQIGIGGTCNNLISQTRKNIYMYTIETQKTYLRV